ncbi:hypothetical protein PybrP1_010240 [[Pythium] brassicae (nom. inval.)]|nr:hypothetical protein PybrP1_010240 [[Pythium] brassicae (nom. inval.)]
MATPAAPPGRPRVALWKAVAAAVALLLLTPLGLAYGAVGRVLTASSQRLSVAGMALLALLAAAVLLEVTLVEQRHAHEFEAAAARQSDADRLLHELEKDHAFAQTLALLAASLLALLVGQWRFHALVIAWLDTGSPFVGNDRLRLFVDTLAPLFLVGLLWESISALEHWRFVTGLTLVSFALVFILTPLVVAISHAKFWVPARYEELERIERRILRRNVAVPFKLSKVAGLGTVHVPCTSAAKSPKTLVLVHGFAAGNALWACVRLAAFFAPNLEFLAKTFDVYAIEWVGTGRSDRPDFASYEQEAADSIFVNGIEEWRKEVQLEKFFLCGHSMGAMFASSYAVRFPDQVEHLVLVSPAGVGALPPPSPQSLFIRFFRFLWNLRLTPMSVIRYAGPLGPALLRFIAAARVSVMPESSCIKRGLIPVETLAEYWYHNWALKSSGEIAMHTHLHPGVFARKPLSKMLTPATIKIPITFMYGGGPDWMDSVAENFAGHQRVQVLKVPLAGHQVFMDNVEAFNSMLTDVLTA